MKSFGTVLCASFLLAVAGCGGGGGGGSSSGGISIFSPSVAVSGLDTGASETVDIVYSGTSQTITANANTSYTFSDSVTSGTNFTLTVQNLPAGKTCSINGAGTSWTGSQENSSVVCAVSGGSGGGGGAGGGGSAITGPFRIYAWTGGPTRAVNNFVGYFPVSVLSLDGTPLSGAGISNFSFFDDDEPFYPAVEPDRSEQSIYVHDLTGAKLGRRITILWDISTSASPTDMANIKAALTDLANNLGPNDEMALYAFDSSLTSLAAATNNTATLLTAIDTPNNEYSGRDSSTDIWGSIAAVAPDATGNNPLESGLMPYFIVITNSTHTATGDTPSTASTAIDDNGAQFFALTFGSAVDEAALEEGLGDDNGVDNRIVNVPDTSTILSGLNQTVQRADNLLDGLHVIHYRSPQRSGSSEFTVEVNPLADCQAVAGDGGCNYFWNIPDGAFVATDDIYMVRDIINPELGDVITFRIPDWPFCNFSPNYSWNLTVNSGAASGVAIESGQAFEVTLGATAPIDIDVDVQDTNGATCQADTMNVVIN